MVENGTKRRQFLKWMATTGIVATGSSTPVIGESNNSPHGHNHDHTHNGVPDILPTPQNIESNGKSFPLTPVVTLNIGSSADRDAVRELKTILRTAGVKKIRESNGGGRSHGPLSIFLGQSAKSSQIGEALEQLNAPSPADLSDGGYVLTTGHSHGGKKIVLAGADNVGSYYAVQTLRQLLIEHPGRKRLPDVTITDYPEIPMRGVIEGFYGTPWSHEDRLRQLDFYGDYKMNTYIYTPKDDPYLRSKWRKPYPSENLADIEELVNRAHRNHVELTFALSPGLSICYSSDEDFQAIINKFESMYKIGVRSFYIALDDISYTDWNCEKDAERFGTGGAAAGEAQAYLLNRVQEEFIEAHENVEPLQMVPTEYYNVAKSSYKKVLRNKLDSKVLIQWTGTAVVPDQITREQAEAANSVFRHRISIWDNYPVNDYARDRLFVGPVSGRESELNEHGIIGLTSNPMIEAEASKIPLTTVADYVWNSHAYEPAQSWEQALHEFTDDAYEPLRTFVENTRSTSLTGSLSESPELSEAIEDFWDAFNSGPITSVADRLETEFTAVQQAPTQLRNQLDNPNFLEEVKPWFEKAKLAGTAGKLAVHMLTAQRTGDGEKAWQLRQDFHDAVDQFNDNPKVYAPDVVGPFFSKVLAANNRWLGTTGNRTSPITTLGTYQDHTPRQMVDDTLDTFYWSDGAPEPGDAVGVDLGGVYKITDIDIQMAKASSQNDYIHQGTLEISTDNRNWTSLGEFNEQSEISVTPSVGTQARYIRLRVTTPQSYWVVVREFSVTTPDRFQLEVSGNPPPAEGSNLSYIVDQQPETAYEAARAPQSGELLEITFSSSKSLRQLIVLQDSTNPVSGTIQLHSNSRWTTIGQLNDGYTAITTEGIKTDKMRLVWADGATAPVLYEINPWFVHENTASLSLTSDTLTLETGTTAETSVVLTSQTVESITGALTVDIPDGLSAEPSQKEVTLHRGEISEIRLSVTASSNTAIESYEVPVEYVIEDGEKVTTTLTVEVVPATSETNVALASNGAKASSSSVERSTSFTANKAIDGSASTRWSSAHTDDEWIEVELPDAKRIGEAILRWETAYGESYEIQASENGTSWRTIKTVSKSDGEVDEVHFDTGSRVQFVRMQGINRSTAYGYSLYEFELYAVE